MLFTPAAWTKKAAPPPNALECKLHPAPLNASGWSGANEVPVHANRTGFAVKPQSFGFTSLAVEIGDAVVDVQLGGADISAVYFGQMHRIDMIAADQPQAYRVRSLVIGTKVFGREAIVLRFEIKLRDRKPTGEVVRVGVRHAMFVRGSGTDFHALIRRHDLAVEYRHERWDAVRGYDRRGRRQGNDEEHLHVRSARAEVVVVEFYRRRIADTPRDGIVVLRIHEGLF